MNLSVIVFILAGTLGILYFSWWSSIKEKRYHGVARFFSFECIFLLILLNASSWFIEPFSLLHMISWILLLFSILFAVTGFYLLHKYGKPAGKMENTTRLIESGVYRYIRHPLYLSLILLGTGAMLKHVDLVRIILSLVNFASLILTAKIEEREMIARFGDAYRDYMNKTNMFIPFIL